MTNKPYMMEASTKQNTLIAERVVEFLRKRIQIYQSLIPKYIKDDEAFGEIKSPISLDSFLSKHHKIDLERHYKDDEFKIAEIDLKLEEFEIAFAKYIVLQEKEIEELLSLVKKSIAKYGLGKETFSLNESDFIKHVLEKLYIIRFASGEKMPDSKYLRYAKIISKAKTGFCNKISPSITWNLYYNFKITIGNDEEYADYQEICCIDESGTEKEENKIADEEILFADNLQVAKFKTRDGQNDCLVIVLIKTVNGKQEIKRIINSGYFDLKNPLLRERVLNSNETEWHSINDFLNIYGLSEFADHIYNYDDLFSLISEFDKLQSFSENQKHGMKKTIAAAVDFWVNAFINNNIIKTINVPALKKFSHLLSKKIRISLAKNSCYYLEAKYYENNPLYEIAKEVGLDLAFADNNMNMWITRNEVSLGSIMTEEKQTFYKFANDINQGQPSGESLTYTPPKTNE